MPFDNAAGRVFADATSIGNVKHPLIERGIQILPRNDSQFTPSIGFGTDLVRTFSRQLCSRSQLAANYRNHLRGAVVAVVVKVVFAGDRGGFRLGREGQRTYAGKSVTYVTGR